jgi:hypothetical protein
MTTRNTSCTTTNLQVHDTEASRNPIQVDAMPDPNTTFGEKISNKYVGSGINSGLSVNDSQVPAPQAKPVDFRTVQGSYSGDHRSNVSKSADAAIDRIANPPNPRQQMREARLTNKLDSPAPVTFPGNLSDSDAGN